MNRRRTSPSTRRRGWTLIEMVLVVTATSVLSALGISVIMLLMRMEQTGTIALARQRAASRLALQLQADGHEATSVELVNDDDAPTRVKLTLPGGQNITWSSDDDTITRTVSDGDSKPRHSVFQFPDGSARWTLADDARHLSLHLSSDTSAATKTEPASTVPFETTIDVNLGRLADLGRHLRPVSPTPPESAGQEE
ncbi:MAG: type II secretion system protein J [Maioricimonas sp. JB045]